MCIILLELSLDHAFLVYLKCPQPLSLQGRTFPGQLFLPNLWFTDGVSEVLLALHMLHPLRIRKYVMYRDFTVVLSAIKDVYSIPQLVTKNIHKANSISPIGVAI